MRGRDLNPRPPGYEPDELPNCSTPRCLRTFDAKMIILCPPDSVKGIFPKNRRLREKISKRHSRLCQRGSRRAGRGRDAGGTREGYAATGAKRTEGASFDRRGSRRAGRGRDAGGTRGGRRGIEGTAAKSGTGSRRTTPQTIKRYFEKGAHGAALPNFAEMCRSFVENM